MFEDRDGTKYFEDYDYDDEKKETLRDNIRIALTIAALTIGMVIPAFILLGLRAGAFN